MKALYWYLAGVALLSLASYINVGFVAAVVVAGVACTVLSMVFAAAMSP